MGRAVFSLIDIDEFRNINSRLSDIIDALSLNNRTVIDEQKVSQIKADSVSSLVHFMNGIKKLSSVLDRIEGEQ